MQAPLEHTYGHVPPSCHAPLAPQVSGVVPASPAHSVAAGVHEPEQAPATQALFEQAVGAPQAPLALQVSTPLFAHCVVPLAQAPHTPSLQAGVAVGQGTGALHCPLASQVSTELTLQRFVPTAQTPVTASGLPASVTTSSSPESAGEASSPLFDVCASSPPPASNDGPASGDGGA